jgi:hypothetical protein
MTSLYAWSVLLHILAAFVFFFRTASRCRPLSCCQRRRMRNKMKLLLDIAGVTIIAVNGEHAPDPGHEHPHGLGCEMVECGMVVGVHRCLFMP